MGTDNSVQCYHNRLEAMNNGHGNQSNPNCCCFTQFYVALTVIKQGSNQKQTAKFDRERNFLS